MEAKRDEIEWIVKYILNCEWVGGGVWLAWLLVERLNIKSDPFLFLIKLLYSNLYLFVVTFSHTIWGINYMQLRLLSPFNSMLLCFWEYFMRQLQLFLLPVGWRLHPVRAVYGNNRIMQCARAFVNWGVATPCNNAQPIQLILRLKSGKVETLWWKCLWKLGNICHVCGVESTKIVII